MKSRYNFEAFLSFFFSTGDSDVCNWILCLIVQYLNQQSTLNNQSNTFSDLYILSSYLSMHMYVYVFVF